MALDDLDRQGSDSMAMLADAIEDRELTSAEDPAAVIAWRLEQTPEREVEADLSGWQETTADRDPYDFEWDHSVSDQEQGIGY